MFTLAGMAVQLRRNTHKGHARRLMAILLLHEGRTITDVHHLTGAARSTIGRWLRWYRDEGVGAALLTKFGTFST